MRKRDELTMPTSCMSRARDDEWTFVLLGRDAAAPVAVQAWIEERVRLRKNQPDDPQIQEARQWIANVLAEQGAPRKKRTSVVGPCGMPNHAHDCDCQGQGGAR